MLTGFIEISIEEQLSCLVNLLLPYFQGFTWAGMGVGSIITHRYRKCRKSLHHGVNLISSEHKANM